MKSLLLFTVFLMALVMPCQSRAQSDPTTQAFINLGLLPTNPPPPYGTDPLWCTVGLTYNLLSFNASIGWYINNPTIHILVQGNATSPFGVTQWTIIQTNLFEPNTPGSFSFTTLPYAVRVNWLPYVQNPWTVITYTGEIWLIDNEGNWYPEAVGYCAGSSWIGQGPGN